MFKKKSQPTTTEPKKSFDLDRAVELARLGASDSEIITILGCNRVQMLKEHRKVLSRHRAERLVRLKAKLFEMALKGNSQATLYLIREEDKNREEAKRQDAPDGPTKKPSSKPITTRFVIKDKANPHPEPTEQTPRTP